MFLAKSIGRTGTFVVPSDLLAMPKRRGCCCVGLCLLTLGVLLAVSSVLPSLSEHSSSQAEEEVMIPTMNGSSSRLAWHGYSNKMYNSVSISPSIDRMSDLTRNGGPKDEQQLPSQSPLLSAGAGKHRALGRTEPNARRSESVDELPPEENNAQQDETRLARSDKPAATSEPQRGPTESSTVVKLQPIVYHGHVLKNGKTPVYLGSHPLIYDAKSDKLQFEYRSESDRTKMSFQLRLKSTANKCKDGHTYMVEVSPSGKAGVHTDYHISGGKRDYNLRRAGKTYQTLHVGAAVTTADESPASSRSGGRA
eukprot:GHVS01024531.1.p1 GENE.GHVS01024531.1~~GHVS01024531.1.p1  ORF type:complete len:309 (-),score=33.25 GHVS01024531.1:50-976(-)